MQLIALNYNLKLRNYPEINLWSNNLSFTDAELIPIFYDHSPSLITTEPQEEKYYKTCKLAQKISMYHTLNTNPAF